jgi:hypothetical protein
MKVELFERVRVIPGVAIGEGPLPRGMLSGSVGGRWLISTPTVPWTSG